MTHKVAAPIALALITPIALWAEGQVCAQGHVHEKTAPYISAHTDVRIHADQVYDADHEEDEIFNLSTHSHTDLEFSPLEDLFVRSSLKLEQKHSHSHDGGAAHESDGKDKYFDDHILLIEQLKLVYTPDQWELFAGKFNPTAGLNQHDIPGYYGYAIEEEYSILGRIGAGSAYTFETLSMGDHKLEASGFFRDTTVLSEGIMNDSDEPHDLNDGGLANTEDFSSGAISLSGDIFYFPIGDTIHEIDYVAALAHQNAGHGAEAGHDDEDRAVLAGIYKAALTTDLQLKGVGEVKNIQNYDSHEGEDLLISTTGGGIYWKGWELGGSYSQINNNEEPDGELIQTSLGYTWNCGIGLHGGWKLEDEEDETQKSIGMMLSYHGHF